MKFIFSTALAFVSIMLVAQPKHQPDAAEILHDIQKLKVLGSALYVAAHPDDENTRLIAWLANEKMVQTAYLSMTRGDGGQNLIGPEIREQLGIIRTQELLAARRIDGGKQFFTRANDFGYSKSPEETFNVWNEDKILHDVVWIIRKFRPDVIITRFPVTGEGNHGHHTASAILANKAFELTGDPKAFPEQLKYVETWQPKRLFLNTGRWWNPDISEDEPGVTKIDVGQYNPLLGTSYSEMAATSRSQHKSQGFGMTGYRGESNEYLELKKGELDSENIFEGIDLSWSSVGAKEIEAAINEIIKSYNPLKPSNSMNSLLELRDEISSIKNEHWKEIKLRQLDEVIKSVLGLYLEATTANPYLVPGEPVQVTLELTNRSSISVKVESVEWPQKNISDSSFVIKDNKEVRTTFSFSLNEDNKPSTPYWLEAKPEKGYYVVDDQQLIGKGENDPALDVDIILSINGRKLGYTIPLEYKWNDPVKGELRRPVAVVPPVALTFGGEIYLFPDERAKQVTVKIKNFSSSFNGEVSLQLPEGWKSEPASVPVTIEGRLAEKDVYFNITPPQGGSSVIVNAIAKTKESAYSQEVDEIAYDHIPTQTLVSISDAELVKLDVKVAGTEIGYIEGAGDAIPSTLKELGYNVTTLSEEMVKGDLSQYDAIVVGIRALNTNERIGFMMSPLLEYAKNGGVLIMQYNTNFRLITEAFAPYPLELSRDRITVEEAEVKILNPAHPAMNYPNEITAKDFDLWVQERGLYFPDKWDEKYVPLLGIADPGEPETKGSLLVAPYGEGYYVYSGISWFRQLPAGVPGAIRLFTNLLSLGSTNDAK